jgi:hypothetical protein
VRFAFLYEVSYINPHHHPDSSRRIGAATASQKDFITERLQMIVTMICGQGEYDAVECNKMQHE